MTMKMRAERALALVVPGGAPQDPPDGGRAATASTSVSISVAIMPANATAMPSETESVG